MPFRVDFAFAVVVGRKTLPRTADSYPRILLNAVQNHGITTRTDSRIACAAPGLFVRVQVRTGGWVIGADGIKHRWRRIATSRNICRPTGDTAYRIIIPMYKTQGDRRALELLGQDSGAAISAEGGVATEEIWTSNGDKWEMRPIYSEWNELVRSLLDCVPTPQSRDMEWTLNRHFPLPTRIENRAVRMGDAAVCGAGGGSCSLADDMDGALAVHERVRKERAEKTEQIDKSAAVTWKALGEEKRKRDEALWGPGRNPDLWADYDWQDFMWGHGCHEGDAGQTQGLDLSSTVTVDCSSLLGRRDTVVNAMVVDWRERELDPVSTLGAARTLNYALSRPAATGPAELPREA
ncbi:hypothetical protein BO70DRAFT_430996 [Aspergillus heteromorphus CBS 117.55]|uniref:FAD-binding domain-containing protein n=1 Tax=Aspergillus heteromorphus CBS 117.55 TaxID=1448321 RepID=A0A317VQ39_9EURO|nr:uncharacterized protein BO70DRAFT_430996 [Aspergillus heteromorphus CBS 117.55]PWY74998.1 hypothetical protein BO70DRAFT_430996 [Aspergillus heteromorphus CBS 117.55]